VFASALAEHADKVVFLVHITDKVRRDERVIAQVRNNSREEALKGDLPQVAMRAVASAMNTHRVLAREVLRAENEGNREQLFNLLYDLLTDPVNVNRLVGDQSSSSRGVRMIGGA
jgi:hypothetical protein